jgi:biotin transport system substrate-specific component
MLFSLSLNQSLQSVLWPTKDKFVSEALLVMIGVMLLAIASQLTIPLQPVPITLQSITALLIGMSYGARLGAYTIATYLLAGACGLPVFAEMLFGISIFFGPTGGYLIGFLFGAPLSGFLVQKGWGRDVTSAFIAVLLGNSVIFLFGIIALSMSVGLEKAFLYGLKPFMLTELFKMAVAAFIVPKFWKVKG